MSGEKEIGLVEPTYDYNLAWIVSEYLKKVCFKNLSKDIDTFGIFTCGGNKSGMCKNFRKSFNRKKYKT